jgi:hypothetical protein
MQDMNGLCVLYLLDQEEEVNFRCTFRAHDNLMFWKGMEPSKGRSDTVDVVKGHSLGSLFVEVWSFDSLESSCAVKTEARSTPNERS